jgi:hypothetical protein
MSVDETFRNQIDRIQRESKLVKQVTGANLLPRDSFADLIEAAKPAGAQLAAALKETSVLRLEADRSNTLQRALADAAWTIQEGASQFRNLVQPIHDFQMQLAQAVQVAVEPFVQVVQAAQQVQNSIRVALEPLQTIREAFRSITPDQLSAFQKAIAGLADDWLQRDAVEKPVFRLFTKLGLTGLESYLTKSELLQVLKLSKGKGNEAVRAYLFRRFRRAKYQVLNRMVRGWWRIPYMRKRKKAIRAAIAAHKKRQFDLAIPALLPLIDGLAAEVVSGTPNLRKKSIYAKDAAASYNAEEAEVWSECVEQVVCSLIYKDYDFRTSKRPPSSVNRHGILHGRIVDYGSELNSYRVILLLNVMVKIAENKTNKTIP